MPGYTRAQLDSEGGVLANCVIYENCSLYWNNRSYAKHLRPSTTAATPKDREVAIIHAAWDRFLDLLVTTPIKRWFHDAETAR